MRRINQYIILGLTRYDLTFSTAAQHCYLPTFVPIFKGRLFDSQILLVCTKQLAWHSVKRCTLEWKRDERKKNLNRPMNDVRIPLLLFWFGRSIKSVTDLEAEEGPKIQIFPLSNFHDIYFFFITWSCWLCPNYFWLELIKMLSKTYIDYLNAKIFLLAPLII